jgi:hypothetical protein
MGAKRGHQPALWLLPGAGSCREQDSLLKPLDCRLSHRVSAEAMQSMIGLEDAVFLRRQKLRREIKRISAYPSLLNNRPVVARNLTVKKRLGYL